jgi:hypothetical protein
MCWEASTQLGLLDEANLDHFATKLILLHLYKHLGSDFVKGRKQNNIEKELLEGIWRPKVKTKKEI